jgi:hypothetical protein
MQHRGTHWVLAFTLLAGAGALQARTATVTTTRAVPDEQKLTQYRAYRRMHVKSDRFDQEAWMEAWTELDRNGFRYDIVSERGSDYVRNKVFKTMLKREQELVAAGETAKADLTAQNYEFSESPEAGDGERYVILKPKRKDMLLVDGRMVLSEDGRELLRVEGRLSKNPSFWTSLVNVIRQYARLDGVRVPVSTETVAKVKFAGTSHLEVLYEYESINGRPVSVQARRIGASFTARER